MSLSFVPGGVVSNGQKVRRWNDLWTIQKIEQLRGAWPDVRQDNETDEIEDSKPVDLGKTIH